MISIQPYVLNQHGLSIHNLGCSSSKCNFPAGEAYGSFFFRTSCLTLHSLKQEANLDGSTRIRGQKPEALQLKLAVTPARLLYRTAPSQSHLAIELAALRQAVIKRAPNHGTSCRQGSAHVAARSVTALWASSRSSFMALAPIVAARRRCRDRMSCNSIRPAACHLACNCEGEAPCLLVQTT